MKHEQLSQQVELGTIEKVTLSKTPASDDHWFAFLLDRQSQQFDILTTDQDKPLAFEVLDDAMEVLCQSGFDGTVTVLWDKTGGVTCN